MISDGEDASANKKGKKAKKKQVIDPDKLLKPAELKAVLDSYVIGQDEAKKIINIFQKNIS